MSKASKKYQHRSSAKYSNSRMKFLIPVNDNDLQKSGGRGELKLYMEKLRTERSFEFNAPREQLKRPTWKSIRRQRKPAKQSLLR